MKKPGGNPVRLKMPAFGNAKHAPLLMITCYFFEFEAKVEVSPSQTASNFAFFQIIAAKLAGTPS